MDFCKKMTAVFGYRMKKNLIRRHVVKFITEIIEINEFS